ncbi:MAG: 6,7-dimethyl-8-ribityllumazine synthase [Leptospiraceae bacterium]|nr:6,7-dimethyl-8-ribityllumazine synthase [Leptospiraceae bacterium]MCP5512153.1 6,7-dimethyl-8-ribityllumazine synthase [Leptospiraceae bacterium]
MSKKEIRGDLDGKGMKISIVVARFNEFITDNLLKGCLESLEMHGVSANDIKIYRVPGAYEIPLVVEKLAIQKNQSAIIALGAVIRGSTAHFDYVAGESAKIGNISQKYLIPVIFGVLTTDTIEQAIERAGTKAGNKGFEAATTAIEMISLLKKIDDGI